MGLLPAKRDAIGEAAIPEADVTVAAMLLVPKPEGPARATAGIGHGVVEPSAEDGSNPTNEREDGSEAVGGAPSPGRPARDR